jgi:ubiquinone biosynthesis protein UbiJ
MDAKQREVSIQRGLRELQRLMVARTPTAEWSESSKLSVIEAFVALVKALDLDLINLEQRVGNLEAIAMGLITHDESRQLDKQRLEKRRQKPKG